jgi:hypothetical protein
MKPSNEETGNGAANEKRLNQAASQRWDALRRFLNVLMRALSAWAV